MTIAYNFATTSGNAVTAATDYLLYTAPSKSMILGAGVTCLAAAGITAMMKVTTGTGVVVGYIFPPASPVGYNNGLVETRKITLLSGYKVYIQSSLAIATTPDNGVFDLSVAEGIN